VINRRKIVCLFIVVCFLLSIIAGSASAGKVMMYKASSSSFFVEGRGYDLYKAYNNGNFPIVNKATHAFKKNKNIKFKGENSKVDSIYVINHKWNKHRGTFISNGNRDKTIQIWYPSGKLKIIG